MRNEIVFQVWFKDSDGHAYIYLDTDNYKDAIETLNKLESDGLNTWIEEVNE